jgi:serine/threonine-protein kinase RsbW
LSGQWKTIRFQIPAQTEALIQLEEQVKAIMSELPKILKYEIEQYNFILALQELCVNIIEHAYHGFHDDIQIELTLQSEPQIIRAQVIDSGGPFDKTTVAAPNLEDPQERGYGLFLIEQLVDDFTYTRLATGNQWQLKRIMD